MARVRDARTTRAGSHHAEVMHLAGAGVCVCVRDVCVNGLRGRDTCVEEEEEDGTHARANTRAP
eukprot:1452395-Prymnesium_polylepis.1